MLPILEAEESMLATTRGMIAAGNMPAKTATPILNQWERLAKGEADEGSTQAPKVDTNVATRAGITVRKVKKRKPEPEANGG